MEQPSAPASIGLKTAIGAAWVVSWRVLSRLLGVISIVVLARLLTPDAFGLVAIATSIVGALDAFSVLGWQDAVIRSQRYRRELLNTAFTISFVRGLAMALLVAASAPFVAAFFSDDRLEPILYLLALLTALEGFENVGPVEFRRNLQFDREFVQFAIPRALAFVATICFALYLRNYWALVIGIAVGRVAKFAVTYTMHAYRPRPSLAAIDELLGFSLWTWATSIMLFARDRSPAFIIGRALGADAVGRFTMGQEIAMLPISELVHPMSRALFAGASSAHRDGQSLADVFSRAIGVMAIIILPAAIGISAVAHFIVPIALGPTWQDVIPIIQWLGVAAPFSILTTVCGTCLIAAARLKGNFVINALAAALMIGLAVVAVSTHGMMGVLAAICAVLVLEAVVATVLTCRWLGGRLSGLAANLWRPVVATAAMAAALAQSGLGWATAAGPGSLDAAWNLILTMAIGAAAYACVAALLWILAGRPYGAERWLLDMALRALAARRRPPAVAPPP